jgi:hypothetical protein
MKKPSKKELLRQALWDAIDWQRTLAQAYAHIPDAPERLEALAQIRLYRSILNSNFGSRTPSQKWVKALARSTQGDKP